VSPSPTQRKEAHARQALAYQMGINGDSVADIAAATGWSPNYVHTFLAEAQANYDGIRAQKGRPAIPRALADQYRDLVDRRDFKPKEAARVLGL
jgi:hypothetical protein